VARGPSAPPLPACRLPAGLARSAAEAGYEVAVTSTTRGDEMRVTVIAAGFDERRPGRRAADAG